MAESRSMHKPPSQAPTLYPSVSAVGRQSFGYPSGSGTVSTFSSGASIGSSVNSGGVAMYRKNSSLSGYQTTPITKHYALNNQILSAFESHYEDKLYTVAYAIGLRFVETALLEIPKHGYFYSKRHDQERMQSSLDAIRVTHLLKEIVSQVQQKQKPQTTTQLDDEVPWLGESEVLKVEKLASLALEQCEISSTGDYDKKRRLVEAEIQGLNAQSQWQSQLAVDPRRRSTVENTGSRHSSLTASLLACGDSMSNVLCPAPVSQEELIRSPMFNIAKGRNNDTGTSSTMAEASVIAQPSSGSARSMPAMPDPTRIHPSIADHGFDERTRSVGKLYPSLSPTSPFSSSVVPEPPKHERASSDLDLQRALYLSGLEVTTAYNNPMNTFNDSLIMDAIPEQHNSQRFEGDNDNEGAWLDSHANWKSQDSYRGNDGEYRDMAHGHDEHDAKQQGPPITQLPRFSMLGSNSLRRESSLTFLGGGTTSSGGLSINMVMDCYHEDFDALRNNGRIRISKIDTYQGRVPASTNGCTVIAPLLCIHHFHNDSVIPDPGLPDGVIVQVIDEETPNILPKVREDLGLVKDAFIIPSDAHDCLMDQQYMCHEQFVSVCGGNILDESHIQPLVDYLKTPEDKKIAASVFFKEHVITILQLRRTSQRVWYDLIDSLPHEKTLSRIGEDTSHTVNPRTQSNGDISTDWTSSTSDWVSSERSGISLSDFDVDGSAIVDLIPPESPPHNAVRIRCLDEDSLKATLRWYACSVFSDENKAYIDTYKWDEKRVDFDPRVFQAFIWKAV